MDLTSLSKGLGVVSLLGVGALLVTPMSSVQACGFHTTHAAPETTQAQTQMPQAQAKTTPNTANATFQVPNAPVPNVLALAGGLLVAGSAAAILYHKHRLTQASPTVLPTPSENLPTPAQAETLA